MPAVLLSLRKPSLEGVRMAELDLAPKSSGFSFMVLSVLGYLHQKGKSLKPHNSFGRKKRWRILENELNVKPGVLGLGL